MLQNADDAEATVVHFINDPRSLPDERVFEDSWKPLQGPALCVFNDKSFSTQDLRGIQNLGEGSKSHDPTKTGQYGVGFNCVYHLTDAPTFLTTVRNSNNAELEQPLVQDDMPISGTVLCAFDPNCKFVPGATHENPGAMFDKIEDIKEMFCDVFCGYLQNI